MKSEQNSDNDSITGPGPHTHIIGGVVFSTFCITKKLHEQNKRKK